MWVIATLVLCALLETSSASDSQDLGIYKRSPRGRKNKANANSECRYKKGQWGECNPTTHQKTRILTLKRGDENECDSPKIETKKCAKLCRYQKGQWSECGGGNQQMERIDALKTGSDPTCEPKRRLTKKCKDRAGQRKSGKKSRNNNNNN